MVEAAAVGRVDKKEGIGYGYPEHVAIIPDGNRRWARDRMLDVSVGYKEGARRLAEVAMEASLLGVRNVTFWIVSPDNIAKRDPKELGHWYDALTEHVIESAIPDLIKPQLDAGAVVRDAVRFKVIGRMDSDKLPEHVVEKLVELEGKSKKNTGTTLVFAMNYSGREEIDDAFIHARMVGDEINSSDDLRDHLYTTRAGLPDPDWIIRTGQASRLSAFMPLQTMTADYDFPDLLWPNFSSGDLWDSLQRFKRVQKNGGR